MTPPQQILRALTKLLLAGIVIAACFELACQLYAVRVIRQLRATKVRPDHYYEPSENPVLAYELDQNRTIEKEGRTLRLNRHGIRDDRDEIPTVEKIAVLGDSVVFGNGFSQNETIPAYLQSALDPMEPSIKVLNLGVPGYNLPELVEHLRVKNEIYLADHIIYVLNPNDFCRRDTRYEGADNGLYRMYHPPYLKSVWFLRKLLYQWRKEGVISVNWYKWIYEGNRDAGLDIIAEMSLYAQARQASFSAVLLPAGCAFNEDRYELVGMYADMRSALTAEGIEVISPLDTFGKNPKQFFTDTDHLTVKGNILMADILFEVVTNQLAQTEQHP